MKEISGARSFRVFRSDCIFQNDGSVSEKAIGEQEEDLHGRVENRMGAALRPPLLITPSTSGIPGPSAGRSASCSSIAGRWVLSCSAVLLAIQLAAQSAATLL